MPQASNTRGHSSMLNCDSADSARGQFKARSDSAPAGQLDPDCSPDPLLGSTRLDPDPARPIHGSVPLGSGKH